MALSALFPAGDDRRIKAAISLTSSALISKLSTSMKETERQKAAQSQFSYFQRRQIFWARWILRFPSSWTFVYGCFNKLFKPMCFSGKFLISWCFPEYAWFVNQDFERGTIHFLLSQNFCLLLLLVRFFSSRCSLRLPRFLIFLRNDTARQTNSHSSHHALSSFRKTLDFFLFFGPGFPHWHDTEM